MLVTILVSHASGCFTSGMRRAAGTQRRLLDDVLGLVERPQHPVRDAHQVVTVFGQFLDAIHDGPARLRSP